MGELYQLAIIGGGAAGLASAVMAGEELKRQGKSYKIILLEKLGRMGKKLAVTGNGRGNLTNVDITAENYHAVEGVAADFVQYGLKQFGSDRARRFIEGSGAMTITERGRVYPASLQASSVVDLLRAKIHALNVEVRVDFEVVKIQKGAYFAVYSQDNEVLRAEKVILATGGKCQKQFGTDGGGYLLAKQLGHSVTECYPSLVQLKTKDADLKTLKGVRQEVLLGLYDGGKQLKEERGDILFTEYGVSGNAVFGVSSALCGAKQPKLRVNFMPDTSDGSLYEALSNKIESCGHLTAEDLLTGILNKQLGRVIVRRCGVDISKKCPISHVNAIVREIRSFSLTPVGTLGFNYAQVTHGGVRLAEIDRKSMQSLKCKGAYVVGELADIDGDCGGYNLHWAMASAHLAIEDIFKNKEVDRQ